MVVIVEPVAVENDRNSLDIAPDLLSNTVIVEPVAVEKFKFRTLIKFANKELVVVVDWTTSKLVVIVDALRVEPTAKVFVDTVDHLQ